MTLDATPSAGHPADPPPIGRTLDPGGRMRERAELELAERSKLAAFAYLLVSLILTFATDFRRDHPLMLLSVMSALTILGTVRFVSGMTYRRIQAQSPGLWRVLFNSTTLGMGAIWGAFAALTLARYGVSITTQLSLIALNGMCAAALISLAPARRVLSVFLMLMLVPIMITAFALETRATTALGVMLLLFHAFLEMAGRQVHKVWLSAEQSVVRLEEAAVTLERARADAESANRAKSEFLANMSHEIRTPMNGVLGMSELLLTTPLTPDQRDFASTVRGSALSLLEIINDILDFSKIEAGKMTLEETEFEPAQVAEEVADLLASRAHAKELELICRVAPGLPRALVGDPGRLRQVLLNLLGNAIKFTERGEVELSVEALSAGDERVVLWFSVRDTGIGISPERQSAVFESFTQADGSMTRRFGGTGLGLTISRQFVSLMGGMLTLDSTPGVGSVFAFAVEFQVAPGAAAAAIPAPELTGKRVLYVDSHPATQRVVEPLLGAWGASVVCVDSTEEAGTRLEASRGGEPFQLVLLDLNRCAAGAARLVMDARRLPQPPALLGLASAMASAGADTHSSLGLDGVIAKPLRHAAFGRALVVALGGRVSEPEVRADAEEIEVPVGLRVLLVEDNAVNRKVATRLIAQKGATVDAAVNGREGVEAWASAEFDMVFMDVQMPEMDGFEATAEIRRREALTGQHTPIIAMTAHAMSGDRERCLAAGMDDYVTKPVRAESLYEAMGRWAGRTGDEQAA